MSRLMHLILALLLVPALCACSAEEAGPLPPSDASIAAVSPDVKGSRDDIAHAIDRIFDPASGETRGLLVLQDGKPVVERFGEGYGPDNRFIGWSVTKSVTGVLIGMLIADGSLALDQPAPIPDWQRAGDPRGGITIRHLLQMRSGLRHEEKGEPNYTGDTAQLLFTTGRDDMAAYAESQPLDFDPGSTFEYSTATSVILADIATRTLTDASDPQARRAALDGYLHDRLLEPLGMDAVAEYDAAGTFAGGSMMHASLRDWAKFGEMLRNRGVSGGTQIVPRGWIDFMTRPSPEDAAYGAHIWLNRPRPEGRDVVLFPESGPKDLFSCVGYRGQFIMVARSKGLTVVRLGYSGAEEMQPLRDGLADLVAAFPDR